MSAPTDLPDDPIGAVQAIGLAQGSAAASGLAGAQAPEQLSGSTTSSQISIGSAIASRSIPWDPARDRLLASDIPAAGPSRRSSLVVVGLVGLLLAFALTAVLAISHLPLADSWGQLAIDRTIELASSSEPLASANPAIRAEPAIPKLIVQSSRAISGEPGPLGLALQGRAEGAVVIITGLVPGMELSTGGAVGGDAWQLSATDLHYAWIAPPKDFVGSADLVAELHLSNDKIADQQVIHLEWMTPTSSAPASRELDREAIAQLQLDRQEITAPPPISPAVPQRPVDRKEITAAPPISEESAQRQLNRKESLLKRGKNNFGIARRDAKDSNRRSPFVAAYAGDSTNAPKGFWDWSR